MNATPDQPHNTPDKTPKPSGVATQDAGIDSREMHQEVIGILKDPQFGLGDFLKGKETLSPQEVTKIWRGENLKMLKAFPVDGTGAEKQDYLKKHQNLKGLIDQTRQILSEQAKSKNKVDTDQTDLDAVLKTDLQGVSNSNTPEKDGSTPETPEARKARLGKFIETHFSDICPPEFQDATTGRCIRFEDQYRKLFDEENLQLSEEDVAEPDLKKEIKLAVSEARNDKVIATRTKTEADKATTAETQNARIANVKANVDQEKAKTPNLKVVAEKAETQAEGKEIEANSVAGDQKIIKENYPHPLKEQHGGSIGALRALVGMVKSPKTKEKIKSILATISAILNAIPGKSAVITRMIDHSDINLSASSPIQMLAGFLADADKSDELTDEDKTKIRQILHKQIDIKSGTDMKKALDQGRGVKTITDKDGNTHTEIIKYDEDHPAEIQPGQYIYTAENGDKILKINVDSGKPPLKFILPKQNEADMAKVGIMGQVISTLDDYNMANPIFQKGLDLKNGGAIRLDWPKDWVTTEKVLKIFFDKTTGWDGALLPKEQTEKMKYLLQGHSAKGDATRADADDQRSSRDFKKQGILDENGDVDWERFEEVVKFNREHYGVGLPEFKDGEEEK